MLPYIKRKKHLLNYIKNEQRTRNKNKKLLTITAAISVPKFVQFLLWNLEYATHHKLCICHYDRDFK